MVKQKYKDFIIQHKTKEGEEKEYFVPIYKKGKRIVGSLYLNIRYKSGLRNMMILMRIYNKDYWSEPPAALCDEWVGMYKQFGPIHRKESQKPWYFDYKK